MNEKNMPCAYWREGEICAKGTEPGYTDFCVLGPCSQMKPSNADHIRQMSDEEIAEFLAVCDASRFRIRSETKAVIAEKYRWLDWLKQEVDSDDMEQEFLERLGGVEKDG